MKSLIVFTSLFILFTKFAFCIHVPSVLNRDEIPFVEKMAVTEFLSMKSNVESSKKKEKEKLILFSLNNDNYLLLDQFAKDNASTGDDFGQTHSMVLEYIWTKKNQLRSLRFETALFSRAIRRTTENSERIVSQRFREITSLEYTWQKSQSSFAYKVFSAELGFINDHKPITGLALWQQSGSSGRGGYHKLIGVNTKLRNISSGGHNLYGGASFTYGHLLPFGLKRYSFFNRVNFSGEARLKLRTLFEGSSTSLIAKGHYNFIKSKGKPLFSIKVQTELNYYFESTRTGTNTLFGLHYNNNEFGAQINYIVPFGEQNERFYKYTDRDPIINLTVVHKF